MNYTSHNGSPQQIPLPQLLFANEAKPSYNCRAFWAIDTISERCILEFTLVHHWARLGVTIFLWFLLVWRYALTRSNGLFFAFVKLVFGAV